MAETGNSRFPGNLDPRAQEFTPRNPINNPTQIPIFTPPQVYYTYATLPLPPLPTYPQNDLQVLPFSELAVGCYTLYQYSAQPPVAPVGYVSVPHLPPPSAAPTRALVLSPVPVDVRESRLRMELEVYGEVRGVQMERVCDGIATVHFYDLRHAERALKEIREQHMQQQTRLRNPSNHLTSLSQNCGGTGEAELINACETPLHQARGLVAGRAVWAQFIIPASNAVPDGNNQGSLVVFNLDPGVSSSTLKEIFEAYGPVKELRETPYKKHQKFVEFYDIRDAAKALREMSGKEIHGNKIVVEFSRPGGLGKKFFNANNRISIATSPSTFTSSNILINSPHRTINSRYPPPPPPPPPLPRKFCSRPSCQPPRSCLSHSQSFSKKFSSNSNKGNPNGIGSSNKGSIEASMGSLSLNGGVIHEEKATNGAAKKKNQNNQSSKQQHHWSSDIRPWKSKQLKKFDTRFLINEDAMVESNCRDSRTTVMIKNIPNKYSQKLLLNMLDNHCIHCNEQIAAQGVGDQPLSSYDFVYLPIDFNNKCNVGYGFVNMTSQQATLRLYKAFHLQHWEVFNSRKICEVTYARVQGLEALKEHFKSSKFPCEMDHYLPVVFSPPRDGRQLTDPLAIVGHKPQPIIKNGLPNPIDDRDHVVDGDDETDGDLLGNGNDYSTVSCESDKDDNEDGLIGGSCSRISSSKTSLNGGEIGGDDLINGSL